MFSGYNTRQALRVIPWAIPTPAQGDVRLITIFFGANDATYSGHSQHVPLDEYQENLKKIVNHPMITIHKPQILLLTPPPVNEHQFMFPDRTAERTKTYADALKKTAQELNLPVVDIWSAFLRKAGWQDGDPLLGRKDVEESDKLKQLLLDGLHFTPAGYKVMYKEVTRTIRGRLSFELGSPIKTMYAVLLLVLSWTVSGSPSGLLTDLSKIQRYWGQITPYFDNAEDYFGVESVGLPGGCQVEQAHLLQRHGARFPISYFDDGTNDENFSVKLSNFTTANPGQEFTGPLSFLNGYRYTMGQSYLIGSGASQLFSAGVSFWQQYGRTLYNASDAQLAYNASYANGTARPKPVLRTTSQSRIENTQINWALGFFGPSFEETPNPTLANATSAFNLVIIPEGGTENNTLAAYDSCFNAIDETIGYLGDLDVETYIPKYLTDATARMQKYAPSGFNFSTNDTYAMQNICAYEISYLGSSDFCGLFTEEEWAGFEVTLDIAYFYDYAYGNPTGRAQGIGYVQELMARLTNQYIYSSNSSVNSSITNNSADFPLGRPFYADFSHDDIIVSALTALSLDYLNEAPSLTEFPPDPKRHFYLSHLTPFAARLVTEVVGCSSSEPKPVKNRRTYYSPDQYGYNAENATNKFIRMRLNNGILPLSTIRGGSCGNRTDGLCPMQSFIESQQNAYELSNYDYACFGNYTLTDPTDGHNYDGTINNGTKS
ncbi:putative histidine phosphatase superfamily clade-2 [Phaeomoniella chlamydospora]|uniref:3-phytase n=1 Tax=Phaeomoniella chlamydospora TaxID=158046 RepID=A0A0G2DWZ6_PHACM|nr:putative histidine phosphatase superfamily clade-2 [Phaeomoniella chlamydospora]